MRELHWHPNADEMQYYISGQARMTVFAADGNAGTFDYQPGDVGFVPRNMRHYIENTGTDEAAVPRAVEGRPFRRRLAPAVAGVHAVRAGAGAPEDRQVGPGEHPDAQDAGGAGLSWRIKTALVILAALE